jgi:hypothetical protein
VLARRMFRLGPIVLFPLMILWAQVCYRIGSSEAYDWWRTYPLYAAVAVAVLWHAALLIVEKDRFDYLMYAIVHLPIFVYAAFISGVYATRAPL